MREEAKGQPTLQGNAAWFRLVLALAVASATVGCLVVGAAGRLAAQDTLPGSRLTNAGVLRANQATDSIFIARTRLIDTVDIGDFASMLLARIGAPTFPDSLGFRVTADSQRIRISGRLMDFPPDSRAEIGPIFSFIDSTSMFVARISMPQADHGVMVFRLDGVSVRGVPIPELLLLAALNQYQQRYPGMLTDDGREFDVAMPIQAHARLAANALILIMPHTP
jgi:hypothetical protein